MPELFARLDKTGLRVLCSSGDRTCRSELARVAIQPDGVRVLCMLDGWKQKNRLDIREHWLETNHSARRRRGAEAAVALGSLAPDRLHARGAPQRRRPIDSPDECDRLEASARGKDNIVALPGPEGILATCPRCDHENTLSAAHLRVAPAPTPAKLRAQLNS